MFAILSQHFFPRRVKILNKKVHHFKTPREQNNMCMQQIPIAYTKPRGKNSRLNHVCNMKAVYITGFPHFEKNAT
jgi:hypothetical protein